MPGVSTKNLIITTSDHLQFSTSRVAFQLNVGFAHNDNLSKCRLAIVLCV
jgi:hypothetical protein